MRPVALLILAFFAPLATGCISNEYVIPHDELGRLAQTPPSERGRRVHAVQEIGGRRGDAVEVHGPLNLPEAAPPPMENPQGLAVASDATPDDGGEVDTQINVNGDINIDGSGSGSGGGGRPAQGTPGGRPGDWRGSPAGRGEGWRGSPSSGAGSGWRGSPSGAGHSGGGGGGVHIGGGGGGGGGNIGDAAVVLAVVAVVVVVLVAVGVAASEGVRFDGYVEMSPEQPVHLRQKMAGDVVVPLYALTEQDVAATVEAKVMDDEGSGLRRINHVLDRRGFSFKLDFGTLAFEQSTSTMTQDGPIAHLQLGYFFSPSFGVLLTAALGGAADGFGAVLTRHEFGLELQSLPLAAGPLHFGVYGNGGYALATTTAGGGAAEQGMGFGGGALAEIDLTGRMALMLRGGGDLARFPAGWSPAASVGAGIAFY
jgi:hypothetical protein